MLSNSKRKGDLNDLNDNRGISVLPTIAKIFEKKLAYQIQIFLNANRLLFSGQHGFRSGNLSETDLHELCCFLSIAERHLNKWIQKNYLLNFSIKDSVIFR